MPVGEGLNKITPLISFSDRRSVQNEIESKPINQKVLAQLERDEDEQAELEDWQRSRLLN